MDVASTLTYSASGTTYIHRCQAAGVMPGALPFGSDGSGNGPEADNSPGSVGATTPKTSADKMREDWLKMLGLKADDLKAMPTQDRDALETRIREQVRDQMAANPNPKTGAFVNVRA